MTDETQGVTAAEAARSLECSRMWIYRLIQEGRIRVLSRSGQPREAGRFARGGWLLSAEDVARETEARGK